jgi:hypothetical protein
MGVLEKPRRAVPLQRRTDEAGEVGATFCSSRQCGCSTFNCPTRCRKLDSVRENDIFRYARKVEYDAISIMHIIVFE